MLPNVFNNYFINRNDIHNSNTRNAHKIEIPRMKKLIGDKTLRVKGAKLYNALPNNICVVESIDNFTRKIITYFIQQYYNG